MRNLEASSSCSRLRSASAAIFACFCLSLASAFFCCFFFSPSSSAMRSIAFLSAIACASASLLASICASSSGDTHDAFLLEPPFLDFLADLFDGGDFELPSLSSSLDEAIFSSATLWVLSSTIGIAVTLSSAKRRLSASESIASLASSSASTWLWATAVRLFGRPLATGESESEDSSEESSTTWRVGMPSPASWLRAILRSVLWRCFWAFCRCCSILGSFLCSLRSSLKALFASPGSSRSSHDDKRNSNALQVRSHMRARRALLTASWCFPCFRETSTSFLRTFPQHAAAFWASSRNP
mmetsp:Transcript_39912/g.93459  ORF Transcript_39912/g.93459 Transcript_39912/m.93459 type:complete len:298 (+) Transcript_39912:143-1036(+)